MNAMYNTKSINIVKNILIDNPESRCHLFIASLHFHPITVLGVHNPFDSLMTTVLVGKVKIMITPRKR